MLEKNIYGQTLTQDIIELFIQAFDNTETPAFKRAIKRWKHGEPYAYIIGSFLFNNLEFLIDRRAYITDSENIHLIQKVKSFIEKKPASVIAEIGFGCGSLGISLAKYFPNISIIGLDIDQHALALGQENIDKHNVNNIQLIESDLFNEWPLQQAPELIFGDVPWGDHHSIYDEHRTAAYYYQMPQMSAFPLENKTQVHQEVVQAALEKKWHTTILLNCGILSPQEIQPIGKLGEQYHLHHPKPSLTILEIII